MTSIKVEDGGSIGSCIGGNEHFRFHLVDIEISHPRTWSHIYGLHGCVEGSLSPAFVDKLVTNMVDLIRSGDKFVAFVGGGGVSDGSPGGIVDGDDYLSKGIGGGCCRDAENGKKKGKYKHENVI